MASSKKGSVAKMEDTSMDVLWEDQEKINNFARDNLQMQEFKSELKLKQKEYSDLEFAEEELMMLDDGVLVPLRIGSTFIHQSSESALEVVQKRKEDIEGEQGKIQGKINALKDDMDRLRLALYAKFGKSINLEPEEEEDEDDT